MAIYQEPTHYIKTILSDLQGAWGLLRQEVVKCIPFENDSALMLHIDEGMSWESVRDLQYMRKTLILVKNIADKSELNNEVYKFINETLDILDESIAEYIR